MTKRRTRIRKHTRVNGSRDGLAPVEMVLYLPIMLFVMALMINFGNMAAWKIRSQGNTRYSAWRTLQDRTGQRDPNPQNWPSPATLTGSGGQDMTDVNVVWNGQQFLITPVTRGPVIVDPNGGRSITVPGRFDMQQGAHGGDSEIQRKLPLLRTMMRNNGSYRFNQHHELLDHRWDYRHLQLPTNPFDRGDIPDDAGNMIRRAKRWYRLDPPFFPDLQAKLQRLAVADMRLKANPNKADLDPLDRDDEFFQIRMRQIFGNDPGPIPPNSPLWDRVRVPDFHPLAGIRPHVDKPVIKARVVDPLIQRIQHLPGSMAQAFINLYQGEISRLQQLMPPPQAEIQALQMKLDQVRQFRAGLPRMYR